MPHRSMIERRLLPAERAEFNRLAMDPHRSINDLTAWVRARGYSMARSSVGRYRKALQARADGSLVFQPIAVSDADARRQLVRDAKQLSGGPIRMLAALAACLLKAQAITDAERRRKRSSVGLRSKRS